MFEISIHFKKLKTTEAIKSHVEAKVSKLEKYVTYPMKVQVILGIEKTLHCAEITCHAEHRDLVAIAKAKNLYEAIDLASHKVVTQLRKEREKRKGHETATRLKRTSAEKLASDLPATVPHREKVIG